MHADCFILSTAISKSVKGNIIPKYHLKTREVTNTDAEREENMWLV